MVDVSKYMLAKSDQLNADDLIGGPITVTITAVHEAGGDQPIVLSYENDNGRPWKPCKTMLRLIARSWTKYAQSWVGKSLTLYNDPDVTWAGKKVGGIRVSHMSDIDKKISINLSASKTSKRAHTVLPLEASPAAPAQATKPTYTPEQLEAAAQKKADAIIAEYNGNNGAELVEKHAETIGRLKAGYASIHDKVMSELFPPVDEIETEPSLEEQAAPKEEDLDEIPI